MNVVVLNNINYVLRQCISQFIGKSFDEFIVVPLDSILYISYFALVPYIMLTTVEHG